MPSIRRPISRCAVGARCRPDHPALAVPRGQGHDRQFGVGDRPGLPRDPVEHLVRAPLGQQRRRDRVRRLQPLLPPPAVPVQAGFLHRDARRGGQRDDHLLVAAGELGRVDLVGQVEVAEHAPPTRIGTPRKLCIGGWCGGKPYDRGCRRMSGRRTGSGCAMSSPSTPLPVGCVPIVRSASRVQPGHEELAELAAPLVEHAERAVAGAAEPRRRLDDAAQHVGQAQVACDSDDRVQQSASLVAGEFRQDRGFSGGRRGGQRPAPSRDRVQGRSRLTIARCGLHLTVCGGTKCRANGPKPRGEMARGPRGERWGWRSPPPADPGRPQLRADCIPGDDDMDPAGRDPLRGRAVRRRERQPPLVRDGRLRHPREDPPLRDQADAAAVGRTCTPVAGNPGHEHLS